MSKNKAAVSLGKKSWEIRMKGRTQKEVADIMRRVRKGDRGVFRSPDVDMQGRKSVGMDKV